MIRLGILVSHPIQYYAPWFRFLADRLNIEVLYCHRQDSRGQARAGFGVDFEWDVPLLDGYRYRWLNNVAHPPGTSSFFGCDTPEVYELIGARVFDAFLIFGWHYKSAVQALIACWKKNLPTIVRSDSHLRTRRSRLKIAAKYFPYRVLLPRIDAHLYVGKMNKEYLRHYSVPERKLYFSPHFVDNDFFSLNARKALLEGMRFKIRREFNIPNDAFVLLYVGKFIEEKRPSDLILAVHRVTQLSRSNNIHALLVGEGEMRTALNTLANSDSRRIHFAGFRNQTELAAFYVASDLLVLPGYETWGLVVNEAMACGIPAVVSDSAGCSADLIEDGRTGYVFSTGDVEDLANRILIFKQTCETQKSMVGNALADKMRQYSVIEATKGLEKAIENIANNSTLHS
jgi:glycosyltransferase involved in cell wall biosynthesis